MNFQVLFNCYILGSEIETYNSKGFQGDNRKYALGIRFSSPNIV